VETNILDMKKTIADYIGGESSGTIPKLIGILFQARNDAHLSHLKQEDKTLARHNAFAYFYENIGGLIDGLTETYMGIKGDFDITVGSSQVIKDPISYYNKLYKVVDSSYGTEPNFIKAQLDDIQTVIAQTLYMLRYITT